MEHYLFTAIILFLGSMVQGLAGFGFALTVMPLLSLFMPISELVPLTALGGTTINLVLFLFMRRSFSLRRILPLVIGATAGLPFGILLLTHVSGESIKHLLAIIILGYALLSLTGVLKPRGLSAPWGYIFGFLAGILGGAINSNGPAIVIYTSLKKWSADEIKVTMQSFFLASGVMIVFSHSVSGLLNCEIIKNWLTALPVLLGGIYAGIILYNRINLTIFRRMVLFMLIILAMMLLFL